MGKEYEMVRAGILSYLFLKFQHQILTNAFWINILDEYYSLYYSAFTLYLFLKS